jgi:hypothetical protein
MKPYTNLNGKSRWSQFWGDKVRKKIKKFFKKSARQQLKKEIISAESNTCKTCRFSKDGKYNNCWVGTYYAEKGENKFCVEGELWEPFQKL